jgi:hypothetical protein
MLDSRVIVGDELETTYKEIVLSYFEILLLYLPGETEEN